MSPTTPSPAQAFDETDGEIFTALKNARRRYVLDVLADHGQIDKGELVTRVTELEHGALIDGLDRSTDRHNVYVALQQTHLDVLEDTNVIRREGNTIIKGERFERAYRHYQTALKVRQNDEKESLLTRLKRVVQILRE
ncbi:hypothetical protein BDK88_3482 [Natrinema hispanicum]|uniref:DUF7344 domain-containing protein n=1 Tax=Natrinema hispanicum TaxID=392421 RepID=A0A482Y8E4_9EURY|nr:hypothetical protein [Natrinema hispanicum]RZV06475.1 hypothetical protein BDK88_3482 [Natrinema hispanicum]